MYRFSKAKDAAASSSSTKNSGSNKDHGDPNMVPMEKYNLILSEMSTMKDKLDGKSKALIILSQEFLEIKQERDQFKMMAEQLRMQFTELKRKMDGLGPSLTTVYDHQVIVGRPDQEQVIACLKEQNKNLLFEVEDLRMKLHDCEGDLRILREQLLTSKLARLAAGNGSNEPSSFIEPCSSARKNLVRQMSSSRGNDQNQGSNHYATSMSSESLLTQLESHQVRIQQLEKDLQSVLDEKEELILNRDEYKRKCDRLNEKLNELLRGLTSDDGNEDEEGGRKKHTKPKILDIDSLCAENSFLKERIKQLEDEMQITQSTLTKYKSILDKGRDKRSTLSSPGSLKSVLRSSTSTSALSSSTGTGLPSTSVISAKQVQQFIATNGLATMSLTAESMSRLRGLVIALFESQADKSQALAVQKKANRLMGKRIQELEAQLKEYKEREQRKRLELHKKSLRESVSNASQESSEPTTPITPNCHSRDPPSHVSPEKKSITTQASEDDDDEYFDDDESDSDLPDELREYIKKAEAELKKESEAGPPSRNSESDKDGGPQAISQSPNISSKPKT